jgi:hypothetical protein
MVKFYAIKIQIVTIMKNEGNIAPLKKWEDILEKERIDFKKFEDCLQARIDKRDGEGHSTLQINIYYNKSIGVFANFKGLGELIPKLTPTEAIEKFKTYKLAFFSN